MLSNLKNKKHKQFAQSFGLENINEGLLRQAFTHSSAGKYDNERLEFLGDAVLGCVIAEYLFIYNEEAQEHYLTRLRAHLVNKEALAAAASRLGFSELIILGQGERSTGGKQRSSILADAFEAVIGAVFLSQGYAKVREFILEVYTTELSRLPSEEKLKDSKSRLQEWLQQRGQALPEYHIVSETGKPHAKLFDVEITVKYKMNNNEFKLFKHVSRANSRRIAEQQAAGVVLENLLKEF